MGVGLGYDFNERFGMGLNCDVQNTEVDDIDIKPRALTVSGGFRF